MMHVIVRDGLVDRAAAHAGSKLKRLGPFALRPLGEAMIRLTFLCALLLAVASGGHVLSAAPSDVKVTPGELVVDHPTLINLGFEWVIDGDANRNASVEVSYRKQGERDVEAGPAAAAPAGRDGSTRRTRGISSRRTCSPAASSI